MALPGRPVSAATLQATTQKLDVLQSNVRSLQRRLKVLRSISRNSGIRAGEIAEHIDHA